jgi:hypothetical protein
LDSGFKQRWSENGRISWIYAFLDRQKDGKVQPARPPERECQARASSIPVSAGCWPMPDVGHSYWGCSSSILRKKTQPQTEIVAHGAVVVGTNDAGNPLRSLLGSYLFLLDYSIKAAPTSARQHCALHHCRSNTRNRQFHIV